MRRFEQYVVEFGFDSTGFGLAREDLQVSGIHGTLCNPGTGRPESGLALVVGTLDGAEIVSPGSGPDGGYALGLEPGVLYHKKAILLADGDRIELEGTGLSFRIWDGRDLEENACDAAETPGRSGAAAGASEPEQTDGSHGFPTRIFGTVTRPDGDGPAQGYRVVFRTSRDEEIVGRPSGEDGFYTISVEPGLRYEPVAVIEPSGASIALRPGFGDFRLQPGETLRVDIRTRE